MHHIEVAQDYMKKNFINLPNPDLAYLVEGTPEFDKTFELWSREIEINLKRDELNAKMKELNEEMKKIDEEYRGIKVVSSY